MSVVHSIDLSDWQSILFCRTWVVLWLLKHSLLSSFKTVKTTHQNYLIFVKEQMMRTDEFQSFKSTESCNIRLLPKGSEQEQVRSEKLLLSIS